MDHKKDSSPKTIKYPEGFKEAVKVLWNEPLVPDPKNPVKKVPEYPDEKNRIEGYFEKGDPRVGILLKTRFERLLKEFSLEKLSNADHGFQNGLKKGSSTYTEKAERLMKTVTLIAQWEELCKKHDINPEDYHATKPEPSRASRGRG